MHCCWMGSNRYVNDPWDNFYMTSWFIYPSFLEIHVGLGCLCTLDPYACNAYTRYVSNNVRCLIMHMHCLTRMLLFVIVIKNNNSLGWLWLDVHSNSQFRNSSMVSLSTQPTEWFSGGWSILQKVVQKARVNREMATGDCSGGISPSQHGDGGCSKTSHEIVQFVDSLQRKSQTIKWL